MKSLAIAMLNGPRQAVSQRLGHAFVALLLPAISSVASLEDRGQMQFQLVGIGFALAAYRADHNSYPAKLAEMVPKYLATVPPDIFAAAGLHYTQQGEGYLLYSVGPNGKDDGGKGYEDFKAGEDWDDLAIRVSGVPVEKTKR